MLDKILSGRWLLTVVCAVAFLWLVMNQKVEVVAALLIIREVFDKEIESANKSSMVLIFVERRNSLLRKSSFANV